MKTLRFGILFILAASLAGFVAPVQGQNSNTFTLQIGAPSTATLLDHHNDTWRYHKGTNAPQTNWQTISDSSLDGTWASGAGGFGFGDPGIVGEATTLADMLNTYTTLFIRKSFTVASAVDTNAHLRLTMDYDDGFVVYLDGLEVQRANTTNGAGSVVLFNATTGGNSHEASCCNVPNPATTYDLGAVGNRLGTGTHILAIVGVN